MTFLHAAINLIYFRRRPGGEIVPLLGRRVFLTLTYTILFASLLPLLGNFLQTEKPKCKNLTGLDAATSRYLTIGGASFECMAFHDRSIQSLMACMYSIFVLV